ncbi:MAG: universal stress protein, partial [Polyangiaceae bacterium]
AAHQGLARSIAKRAKCGVEIQSLSMIGDARSVILDAAKETGADLIVMGTHDRHGLERLFLGSTAEAIIRTSPIPVLTVRATPVESSKAVGSPPVKEA